MGCGTPGVQRTLRALTMEVMEGIGSRRRGNMAEAISRYDEPSENEESGFP